MDNYKQLNLDNQICFRLYVASREIIKKYKPILDKYNLTYTQYLAMLVLWEDEKISVKGMGKRLHLDSGTLTPVIKKLEKMDLVSKYRDPKDDRVVIVELTEKGNNLKDEMSDVPYKALCSMGIEQEKLKGIRDTLDDILSLLE